MGEYEEFLKTLPPEETIKHFGLDKRLDFLGPKIVSLEAAMGAPKIIEQIPFSYNLAILQGVTLTEVVPFGGHIKQITIHWPDGCSALVDVKVGLGVKQFCPREGYLALNNATPTYPFNVEVKEGDPIWVEMRNTSLFPHNITVIVVLEGLL